MNRHRAERAFPGLHVIGSAVVRSYLLVDQEQATLIDTGLFWEPRQVRRTLHRLGWDLPHLKTVLLTHGHLDHSRNVPWYRSQTNARVLVHPLEREHLAQTFHYPKENRICDHLERLGRLVSRHEPAPAHGHFEFGEEIPVWGGLRVISLPGHTHGHCGFYSEKHDLLFTGDLFATYPFHAGLPPRFLNDCPDRFPEAFTTIRELNPRWVLPCHAWNLDPMVLKRRFLELIEKLQI